MRLSYTLTAAFLLAAAPAGADQSTSTCSGMLQMDVGLEIVNPDNSTTVINNSQITSLLDLAECECNSQDIFTIAKVNTPLPAGALNYQVWAGSGCDSQVSRNGTPPACQNITDLTPTTNASDYQVGASNQPQQRVPIQALASPNTKAMCTNLSVSNSLYFLLYTNPAMPENVCSLPLPVHTQPPTAPTLTSVGSGDGAISVSWAAPTANTALVPLYYQVLCSDDKGNPVPGFQAQFISTLGYSVCINNQIQRRRNLLTGGSANIGTDDGGVPLSFPDAGTASLPLTADHLQPDDNGVDGGTPDGGAQGDANAAFGGLDTKYLCSSLLPSTSTTLRIAGLTNGTTYKFAVVGIDINGNPAPSGVISGTPQPVEDLYRRLRDKGLAKQGFCFIATAAYGSYESPFVQVLRDFRDQRLLTNAPGRAFVAWYYAHSPSAASYIAEHGTARFATQQVLQPVILMALVATAPPWLQALLVTLLFALATRRRVLRALARSRA